MSGGGQAPTINMVYNDGNFGEALVQDIMVPLSKPNIKPNTYVIKLGWNKGYSGAGYCGLKKDGFYYRTIFSLLDPPTGTKGIRITKLGHGVTSSHYTTEGPGVSTVNRDFGWKTNQLYTIVVRKWNDGNYTNYGMWIHDQLTDRWFHHATLGYPESGIPFRCPTSCFLKDFANIGKYAKGVYLVYEQKLGSPSNQWIPFSSANYTIDGGTVYTNSHDARVVVKNLATGKGVHQTNSKIGTFRLSQGHVLSEPHISGLTFLLTPVSDTQAAWRIYDTSTPFSYCVKVDGQIVATGYVSDICRVDFNHPGRNIEVTLIYTLGGTDTITHQISRM